MSNLEQSKDRLKVAFMKIENVTKNKVQTLKIENEHLKIEILRLKQQIANALLAPSGLNATTITAPVTPMAAANANPIREDLVDHQTSTRIDLSLSELKKLVK